MKFVTHVALGPNSLMPIQAPSYFDIYNANSRQRSPNATADLPKKKISKKKSKKLKGTTLIEAREGRELTLGGRSPSSHSLMELYSKDTLGNKKKSTKRKTRKNTKLNASLSQNVLRQNSQEKVLDDKSDSNTINMETPNK